MSNVQKLRNRIGQEKAKASKQRAVIIAVIVGVAFIGLIASSTNSTDSPSGSSTATNISRPKPAVTTTKLKSPAAVATRSEPEPASRVTQEMYEEAWASWLAFDTVNEQAKAEQNLAAARPLKLAVLEDLSQIIGCDVDDGEWVGLEYALKNDDYDGFKDAVDIYVCD